MGDNNYHFKADFIVETPISKAKRSGIGKLNNHAKRRVVRLKLQKRSEWKFVSRIIPHKEVFNIPQLVAESVSKACFGVHTSDFQRFDIVNYRRRIDETMLSL